jgi:hypothetical protein
MKKMDDEELQKWMEENSTAKKIDGPESDDAKAYQFLFDVLDAEPLQGLPYDFSAKVTRKVQAEVKRTSELKYYLIGVAIFIVAVVGIYALLTSVKPGAVATPYVTALLQYKWVFILGIFSFLTIQYLDVVLVKRNVFKR